MSEQQRVSTRVDAEVIEVIRRVAEIERRPPSAVIRIALEDWAASRRAPDNRPEAA
jgi:predicted transcriptional regulator